jgi:hypothetical protein
MSDSKSRRSDPSRRKFLTLAGSAGAALVVGLRPLTTWAQAGGAQLPHLSSDDPTAKALGYVDDATKVDKTKFPAYKAGAKCQTCNFFQGGTASTGPCQLFPGKSVNAGGWCASHSPKAA